MPISLWQPKPEVHLEARRLQAARHNPCLSCDGHKQIETPHLDRLAAEGIRFKQFAKCRFRETRVCGIKSFISYRLADVQTAVQVALGRLGGIRGEGAGQCSD